MGVVRSLCRGGRLQARARVREGQLVLDHIIIDVVSIVDRFNTCR